MSTSLRPLLFSRQSRRQLTLASTVLITMSLLTSTAQAISLSDVFGSASKSTASAIDKNKPLPVNEAFNVVAAQRGQTVTIGVDVKDGYYAYRDKLKLELPEGVTASPLQFSAQPTYVNDPDFGRVPVFEQPFTATATLSTTKTIASQPASVKWQGCAKAGLCYPPETSKFVITGLAATDSKANQADERVTQSKTADVDAGQKNHTVVSAPVSVQTPDASSSTVSDNSFTADTPFTSNQSNQDIFGLTKHTGLALLLLFLAGLGLAFTPCVLPMLPIVANIVARQHSHSAKKGILLTGSYGLGVATSYGLLGAVVALFGQSLGILNWLQNPVILLTFAGLFIVLGLYMLEVINLRLPAFIRTRFEKISHIAENRLGSLSGSYLTGLFSALVVSPCVSAPLAGALAGVAALGNPVIGFTALFLLGLGLSTPLILLGATQGNFMPKAGEWMNWVKTGFGLMLFAVALLMIERIWLSSWMLMLWAVWFAVIGVWLWRWQAKGQLLTKASAFLALIWSACLVIGSASGSQDSWQPLKHFTKPATTTSMATAANQNNTIRITKLSQLQPLLAQYPNVLVDVTAAWCIECRIMDKNLFENPPPSLAKWQVIKLDVTDDTPDSKEVYKKLDVFGPPVLLYYQQGKLVQRQNGEVKRPDFEQVLAAL